MASEPPSPTTSNEASRFAIGVSENTRRVIRARRPPRRRRDQEMVTSATLPAVAVENSGAGNADAGNADAGDGNDNGVDDDSLPSLWTNEHVDDANDEEEDVSLLFDVVTPLSLENRFLHLEDDDSIENMPSLFVLQDLNAIHINFGGRVDHEEEIQPINSNQQSRAARSRRATKKKKRSKKKAFKTKKNAPTAEKFYNNICSICTEEHRPVYERHRLVILPCCGGSSGSDPPKELAFSTRFCVGCILKLVQITVEKDDDEYSPWDMESEEFPTDVFYGSYNPILDDERDENYEIIECPRCRMLVRVSCEWKRVNDSDSDCDCPDCEEERCRRLFTGLKSMDISNPSFLSKINFVGRKPGMAQLLWRMAYLPHNIITLEGLGGEEERDRIRKLVEWGILKKNGDVFRLEKKEQDSLLVLFSFCVKNDSIEDDVEGKMYQKLLPSLLSTVLDDFKKIRVGRALRMLNHFGVIHHYFGRRLPPLPLDPLQELVVTGLNILCAGIILRLSLSLVVNGGLFYGSVFIVCWTLRFSARQTDKMKRQLVLVGLMLAMAWMGSYFAYTLIHEIRMIFSRYV